ncbi:general secretion pathway protein K [Sphingobium sp. B1D7B]|uniref:type II secretion system minor pseudopilin GspK n=1 Tax=unclassified Sphingobium TaxID=2611147 RepID=UPI0022254DF8|nr:MULTISPECIES: type II secretion system minor pseudopilin GspK [unclassified Sphingobium]MCW2391424.1 general secretion pathway protein K [Sphingobium sp. B11D3A]MCW2406636.1 general secretion pathway protein K [Sphingobium sp. B1D7B]
MRPDPLHASAATPAHERGAALLTVLLLVAILSVVTAVALDRLTLASRMTRNIVSADQGRAYLLTGEQMVANLVSDLVAVNADRTTLQGGWLGRDQTISVPGGAVTVQLVDRGNCFNLNSLVVGPEPAGGVEGDASTMQLAARPVGIAQFAALMRLLGVDQNAATQIAISAADWIDSDSEPGNGGAEDNYYAGFDPPYRAANTLMADPSELLMVNAMTPQVYQRIRPWVCALPTTRLSPININTLLPGQAVLLAMLAPDGLGLEQARQVLAQRPADGYGSVNAFWSLPQLVRLALPEDVKNQTVARTRWFEATLRADLGGDQVSEIVLIDAETQPARLMRRQWGDES